MEFITTLWHANGSVMYGCKRCGYNTKESWNILNHIATQKNPCCVEFSSYKKRYMLESFTKTLKNMARCIVQRRKTTNANPSNQFK
jgi:hypothetical protein